MTLFLTSKEGKSHWITVMQGWTSRKHLGTLQVVSFLAFLPENVSGINFVHLYAPCDIIAAKTMPPCGRAHPQLHCVQI